MPNYLKPQTPLRSKKNDAYIYPLTTSDQVIMPDGSRLTPDKLEDMILETATPDAIGALSMELLWENASPNSAFASQAVSVDFTGFDYYEILYCTYVQANNLYLSTGKVPCGRNTRMSYVTDATGGGVSGGIRDFTFDTKTFGSPKNLKSATADNNICVPYRIYGIKGASA